MEQNSERLQFFANVAGTEDFNQKDPLVLHHSLPLKEVEKVVILDTLRRQRYNRTHTARVLGIGVRTLQRKLKQYRQESPYPIEE